MATAVDCGLTLERTLAAKILLASSESSNAVINAAVIGSEGEIPSRNLSSIRIMAARRMGGTSEDRSARS